MKSTLVALALAGAWMAVAGSRSTESFLLGLAIGFAVLAAVQPRGMARAIASRFPHALELAGYFLWKLIVANIKVAIAICTPVHRMRPGIVAVPLDAKSDAEISLLANLITLTPGTLSMETSADRDVLYVHVMHMADAESFRRSIKSGLETRVLKLLR